MVQTLARCRSCGLPGGLSESLEWRSAGVIVIRRMRSLRLALLDVQTMDVIRAASETLLGKEACMDAEKEAARLVAARFASGIMGRLSRYGAMKKRVLEAMESYSIILGLGRIEMERFTPGEGGSLLIRRPFDLGVVTAGVAGILEGVDQCSYASALSSAGENAYHLLLSADDPDVAKARSPQDTPLFCDERGGAAKQEGCGMCGLPSSLSQLLWDEIYGTMQAGAGGRRVAFLPAYVLSLLGHLAAYQSADGQEKMVEEAVCASTVRSLKSGEADAYESGELVPRGSDAQAAWAKVGMRGWGDIVASDLRGGAWKVTVNDAVDKSLIAGWLRGLYTVAMGAEPSVAVMVSPPATLFELGR